MPQLERILTERYQLSEKCVQHQLLCKHLKELDREELALLEHGRVPDGGWSEHQIQSLLLTLSKADSPYNSKCGLGEREGRIICPMVANKNFHFVHGIGRSGDLGEWQPKAAGSSLLYRLLNRLLLDFGKRIVGWEGIKDAVVFPVATGMAIFFCLKAFALSDKKKVLWFRADQKSAIKAVILGGYELIVIPGVLNQENKLSIESNIDFFKSHMTDNDIAAVISTTSCFAPRGCDDIPSISNLCAEHGIPHIVNNAYGLQSPAMRQEIQKGLRVGRIDGIVQSGDKNILIPVSCAIVYGTASLNSVSRLYPGRAGISGCIDLFCTLMYLGNKGWLNLNEQRLVNFEYLKRKLIEKGTKFIECRKNDISLAIIPANDIKDKLFHAFAKGISGIRTVETDKRVIIGRVEFKGWQAHHQKYPLPFYVNVAVALGCTKEEIDHFLSFCTPAKFNKK